MISRADAPKFRVEEDSIGNVEVPTGHLWSAQTQGSRRPAGCYRRESWNSEFPLGVFQAGSGIQINRNANEVIAPVTPGQVNFRLGGATRSGSGDNPCEFAGCLRTSNRGTAVGHSRWWRL